MTKNDQLRTWFWVIKSGIIGHMFWALSMDFLIFSLSLEFGPTKQRRDAKVSPSWLQTWRINPPVPAPLGVHKCPEGEFPVVKHGRVGFQQTEAVGFWSWKLEPRLFWFFRKSNQETSGTWNRIFLEQNPVLRYLFRYIFNIKVYFLISIYKHTYQKKQFFVACVITQTRSVCPADPISERSPQGSKLPPERSLPPQRCTPADGEVVL